MMEIQIRLPHKVVLKMNQENIIIMSKKNGLFYKQYIELKCNPNCCSNVNQTFQSKRFDFEYYL